MFGKIKNKTPLDSIDEDFSPELLAYMGEWLTYSSIETQLHNHNASRDDDKQLSFRDLFQANDLRSEGLGLGYSFEYGPEQDRRFFWTEPLLKSYGVISEGITPKHCKSNVLYEQVWQCFLDAPKSTKNPIFLGIAEIFSWVFTKDGKQNISN